MPDTKLSSAVRLYLTGQESMPGYFLSSTSRRTVGSRWGHTFFPLLASLLVGCGSSDGRVGITGEVSLDGEPIKSGSIRLTLVEGEKKESTGAMIHDGSYSIPVEKGLLPGKYHVVLSAADAEAAPVTLRDSSGRPTVAVSPELIPPEYNVNSDKNIDVTADGENHFVFSIETDDR